MATTTTSHDSNVVGLPAQQVERFVSRAELARLMGVSLTTIDKLTREGMPSTKWGLRTRRYRPSVAIAWAQARVRRAA